MWGLHKPMPHRSNQHPWSKGKHRSGTMYRLQDLRSNLHISGYKNSKMKASYILIIITLLIILLGFACKRAPLTTGATMLYYEVDHSSCNGCGECIRVCPNDAIYYNTQGKAVIDQTKCTKCAMCVAVCPNSAIY